MRWSSQPDALEFSVRCAGVLGPLGVGVCELQVRTGWAAASLVDHVACPPVSLPANHCHFDESVIFAIPGRTRPRYRCEASNSRSVPITAVAADLGPGLRRR